MSNIVSMNESNTKREKTMSRHGENTPRPLLWSLTLLSVAIMFKSFNQLNFDYDMFWHILIGEDILKKGFIERFDIYSFTAFGQAVYNHEWLSEIIMALFYKMGGGLGMILWRWGMTLIISALAIHLIFLLSKSGLNRIIIFLCFVLVVKTAISFRVQLFTMTCLLSLLNLIYVYSIHKKRLPPTLLITLLFVLWANLHGGFVLGLVVWLVYVGEYVLKERSGSCLKIAVPAGVFPLLATLANPYGIKLWGFIINELSNPISSQYISEWQRFSFAPRELTFLLIYMLSWGAYFMSGREKGIASTILLVTAGIMGFSSVRHTPLFAVLCLPTIADHFDGTLTHLRQRGQKGEEKRLSKIPVYVVSCIFVSLSLLFFISGLPEKWEIAMEKDELPFNLVRFSKTNQLEGNLWVPLHWGGYVLFHLYPDVRVSIDGRWAMVYPHGVMKDNMTFAYDGKNNTWKAILKKYNADLALVEAGNPALPEMQNDDTWTIAVSCPEGSVLVKKAYMNALPSGFKTPEYEAISWP